MPANTRAIIVFDEFRAICSVRGLDAIFNDPAAPMYGQSEPMTRSNQRATVATWERALDDALKRSRPELEVLWERLSTNDQRVLSAIGTIGSPFRKEATELLGLKKSSARDSVRSLVAGGVLESPDEDAADGSPVDYRTADPLLAQWMLRRFPTL